MWKSADDLSTGSGPLFERRGPERVAIVTKDRARITVTAAEAREQVRAGRAHFMSDADWRAVDPRGYAAAHRHAAAEAARPDPETVTLYGPDGREVKASPLNAADMLAVGYSRSAPVIER